MNETKRVQGNWLALVGLVWYLLEFVAIGLFYPAPPPDGSPAPSFAAYFLGHRAQLLPYAAGVSFAILGRIVFILAVRRALPGRQVRRLTAWAVAGNVASVGVEVVGMALVAAASLGLRPLGRDAAAVHAASQLCLALAGLALAPAVMAAALAMLRAPGWPRWNAWTGLVGAAGMALSFNPLGGRYPAALADARELAEFAGWILIVTWMLATGVTLARRTRARTVTPAAAASPLAEKSTELGPA